jgi:hypothetical protein
MHRIRLHSQWKRDTSNNKVSRFFRSFHSPTGLQEHDRIFLAATITAENILDFQAAVVRLNEVDLRPEINGNSFIVELTSHLKLFNQLQVELPLASSNSVSVSSLWPPENLALEIHPSQKTD